METTLVEKVNRDYEICVFTERPVERSKTMSFVTETYRSFAEKPEGVSSFPSCFDLRPSRTCCSCDPSTTGCWDTTFRRVLTSIRGALLFCPTRFLCSSDIRKTYGAQFPPAGWLGSITNSVCSSESRKRRIKSIQLPRYLISFNFQQRN